ncbi:MAG: DoxX family membrane protein [Chloroflexota bacterium]
MKATLRWLLSVVMVGTGVSHFADPGAYAAIVPTILPSPVVLVYVSGLFEVLGGLGLTQSRTRRVAAWGLIALYVAVFPANVNMAINRIPLGTRDLPIWALYARLPIQALLVAWAFWYTRKDRPAR